MQRRLLHLEPPKVRLHTALMVVYAIRDRSMPEDIAALSKEERESMMDGHWHVWPMQPWYQIRFNTNPNKNSKSSGRSDAWERRKNVGHAPSLYGFKPAQQYGAADGSWEDAPQAMTSEPTAEHPNGCRVEKNRECVRLGNTETIRKGPRAPGVQRVLRLVLMGKEDRPDVACDGDVTMAEETMAEETMAEDKKQSGEESDESDESESGEMCRQTTRVMTAWAKEVATEEEQNAKRQRLLGDGGDGGDGGSGGSGSSTAADSQTFPMEKAYPDVVLPWKPTEKMTPEEQEAQLAYPGSNSGTAQPEECYLYRLDPNYLAHEGPYAPSEAEKKRYAAEDKRWKDFSNTPAFLSAYPRGTPWDGESAHDDATMKYLLKRGLRTPRNFHEQMNWHLDMTGVPQNNDGSYKYIPGLPGQSDKGAEYAPLEYKQEVFLNPTSSSKLCTRELDPGLPPLSPRGVYPTHQKYGTGWRNSANQTVSQGLQFLYPWTKRRPVDRNGGLASGQKEEGDSKNDARVLFVDIGHILHQSDERLFRDAGQRGILPDFEQRQSRKLQVHGISGGTVASLVRQARQRVERAIDRENAAAARANPPGLEVTPEARESRLTEACNAAAAAGVNHRPETLHDVIWRDANTEASNSNSTTVFTTQEADDTHNKWREERMTPTYHNPQGRLFSGGQRPRYNKHYQHLDDLKVAGDEAAAWPLLRREKACNIKGLPIDDDPGVDIHHIADKDNLLSIDDISAAKIKVVTFSSLQGCVNKPEWAEYLYSKDVTADVLDKFNRPFYCGREADSGGVPFIWRLSNFENYNVINNGASSSTSPGVAHLFGKPDMREKVRNYDSNLVPQWRASNAADPLHGGDAPAQPFVDPGSMPVGETGKSTAAEWPRIELDRHLRDPQLSALMQMVTDNGPPSSAEPTNELSKSWWIQKLRPNNKHGDKMNNCFVIPYALYDKHKYDDAARNNAADQRLSLIHI